MRKREEVSIFSLSFLDLIFCAMAGVLVLYSIADTAEREREPKSLTFVELQLSEETQAAHVFVILRSGTRRFSGDNRTTGGDWNFSGSTATLRLKEELSTDAELLFAVRDHDYTKTIPSSYAFKYRVVSSRGIMVPKKQEVRAESSYFVEFRPSLK